MHVSSGSAQVHYDARGVGRPVFLLHAGVTDHRSWDPLLADLGSGFRTVTYDRRGFGATTYEPEAHREMDDALAVLDAAHVGSAIVVGASNGGRRAVDLALAHPERVEALVLIGAGVSGAPALDVERLPADARELVARIDAADEQGDVDLVNELEAHAWLDGWTAPAGRVTGPTRDLFLDMNGIALRAADPGEEAAPPPAWDRLDEIAVPTLVLCGAYDVVTIPGCEHLAGTIPDARFVVLDDTAHLPHLEGHRHALALIADFLAALP